MASRSILVYNSIKNSTIKSRLLLNNFSSNKINYLALSTNSILNQATTKTKQEPNCLRNNLNFNKNQRASIYLTKSFLNETITVECPAFAESITEGNVAFVKKVGDSVQADEVIAKIETDKTAIDLKAPSAGVIESFLVEDGETIQAKTPVIKLRVGGAAPVQAKPTETQTVQPPPPTSTPTPAPSKPEPVQEKKPAPIATQAPPVPKQPLFTTPISQIPVTPLQASSAPVDIHKISGTRAETRIKMSRMRQTIANRLKTAQNTCAMLTTFNEVNMGNLVELRKAYGEQFHKKHHLKLGFMSAFVKAAAYALQDQPVVNAVIENNEIIYRDYVDISVAVATPKGLVVPVLRNVEKMGYADIEKEIAALGEKARTGTMAIEDMQGGTFTISNGGVFGSLFGTPIINLPQSAILGMHGIFDRPVALNGQVVIKPMMYIALTYDHRLIDGREAVTFLRKIKSAVEDPRTLLLDI